MKKFLSNDKGITMLTLTLTIIVMAIILTTITFYARNSIGMESFQNMKADIKEIESKALLFYEDSGQLPIYSDDQMTSTQIKSDVEIGCINQNDGNVYSKVNLELLNIATAYDTDYYINTETLTVYAADSVRVNGKNYRRPVENFIKISHGKSIPDWEIQCNNVPGDMFIYDVSNPQYISGINSEYIRTHSAEVSAYLTVSGSSYTNWKNLVIPVRKSDGTIVKGISDSALVQISYISGEVIIPSNIEKVGNNFLNAHVTTIRCNAQAVSVDAFAKVNNLQTVEIGPSCTLTNGQILNRTVHGAFANNSSLKTAILNGTNVPSYGFYGCSELVNVTINSSITDIGDYAFYGTKIASITLPDSVERIGISAFQNNISLTKFVGNRNLKVIDSYAFAGISNTLTEVDLSSSLVESINEGAFSNDRNLSSVKFSTALRSVGAYAFGGLSTQNKTRVQNTLYGSYRSASIDANAFTDL